MIFLEQITHIPQTIDIKIPTSVEIEQGGGSKVILVSCGGADTEATLFVNGGDADTNQTLVMNCGGADLQSCTYFNLTIDGGFANSDYTNNILGGYADSIQKLIVNGGGADESCSRGGNIAVLLRHIVTNEVFVYKGGIKSQNSLYFTFPFQFDRIPPLGQYDIVVSNSKTIIYKGVLQVGEIKNKNKKYDLIYNGKQN